MHTVGLIFPRFRYPSGDYPIGIALLGAFIRRELGWKVVVCDLTFSPTIETVHQFIQRENPDFVGIGMSTLMLDHGLDICDIVKSYGKMVFVGGPHPTTHPQEMMQHASIDACVIGEGELATIDVLRMFAGQERYLVSGAYVRDKNGAILASDMRRPVENLDTLPFPAWDLVDIPTYIRAWGQLDSVRPGLRGVNITASRGCPFSCTFCQPVLDSMFGKKLRQRSPASVIAELKELHALYNIEAFWFTDDTFTTNRKWVSKFCEELRKSGLQLLWGCTTRANLIPQSMMQEMVDVGLRKIGIGLESATDHIREELYQKGVSDDAVVETVHIAHKLGVQTLLFLMLGAPNETRREMLETIRLAKSLPASEASFSLFVPIPGTDLYTDMQEQGYAMSSDYKDYDYYARQPFVHQISRFELRMWQRYAYFRFYASPKRWEMLGNILRDTQGKQSLFRKLQRIVPL